MTFTETTEIVERSLRRRATNKNCQLMRDGDNYTIVRNGFPVVTVDDDDCWSVLESM